MGYFDSGRSDRGIHIWRARLGHNISPLAYHEVGYIRRVTQPDQDIEQSLSYLLRRSLGQTAQAEFYAIGSRFDDFDGNRSSSDELCVGTRFSFLVAEGTTLRLSGTYAKIDYDADIFGDREQWIAQMILRRRSLEGRLLYRFEEVSDTPQRASYYENLFALTVTKYF